MQDLKVALLHKGEDDEAHLFLHVVVTLLHGNGQGDIAECAPNLLRVGQSNPLNISPVNGSIRLLVQVLGGPILVLTAYVVNCFG